MKAWLKGGIIGFGFGVVSIVLMLLQGIFNLNFLDIPLKILFFYMFIIFQGSGDAGGLQGLAMPSLPRRDERLVAHPTTGTTRFWSGRESRDFWPALTCLNDLKSGGRRTILSGRELGAGPTLRRLAWR